MCTCLHFDPAQRWTSKDAVAKTVNFLWNVYERDREVAPIEVSNRCLFIPKFSRWPGLRLFDDSSVCSKLTDRIRFYFCQTKTQYSSVVHLPGCRATVAKPGAIVFWARFYRPKLSCRPHVLSWNPNSLPALRCPVGNRYSDPSNSALKFSPNSSWGRVGVYCLWARWTYVASTTWRIPAAGWHYDDSAEKLR